MEATPTALSSSVSTTRILAVIEALCQPSEHLLGMYIYASGCPRTVAVACSWGQGSGLLPGLPPHPPPPRRGERGWSGAQQGTEVIWCSLSEHLDTSPKTTGHVHAGFLGSHVSRGRTRRPGPTAEMVMLWILSPQRAPNTIRRPFFHPWHTTLGSKTETHWVWRPGQQGRPPCQDQEPSFSEYIRTSRVRASTRPPKMHKFRCTITQSLW